VRHPYGASIEDAREKLRYDLYYIKNLSLLFDLNIILRTVVGDPARQGRALTRCRTLFARRLARASRPWPDSMPPGA
jgi:hypothetical protein